MHPSNVFRVGALGVVSLWLICAVGVAQKHPDCWLEKKSGYSASFYGTQPPLADIQARMQKLAVQYNVPIEIVAAVCYQESNLLQYDGGFLKHNITECATAFHKGYISINSKKEEVQPPPGLGLMQLTSTTAKGFDENHLISDWATNLEAGVQVLARKYSNASSEGPPWMQPLDAQNRMVLENWYYGVWYYNGSASYIDKIHSWIKKPPYQIEKLFAPVTINKPESAIPGFSGKGFVATASGVWYDNSKNQYRYPVHVSASAQTAAIGTADTDTQPAPSAKPTETIALRFLMPGGSWDFREGYSVFGHSVATETKGVHAIRIPILSASRVSLQREKGRTEAPNKLVGVPFVEKHGDKEVNAYDIEQGLKQWGNKQIESIPFQVASSETYKDGFDLIPSQPLPTGVYLAGLLVYNNNDRNPRFGYPWMFAVGRPILGNVAGQSLQSPATPSLQPEKPTGVSKAGADTFQFLVSDDSGSKSEEWKMTITPIGGTQPITNISMRKFGTKETSEVTLDRNQGYQITLVWEQTKQKRPDFDWSAQLSWKGPDGKYGKMQPTARAYYTKECRSPLVIKTDTGGEWMLDNSDGLMGTSTSGATGKTNVTVGLRALLFPVAMKDKYLRTQQNTVPQTPSREQEGRGIKEVLSPVIGDLEVIHPKEHPNEKCTGTKWCFNQHQSRASEDPNSPRYKVGHIRDGGINGANDTYAWDVNLNTPSWDSDRGKPVYAVARGRVATSFAGRPNAGGDCGQLLIEHESEGIKWWSGYLHLEEKAKNIQVKVGDPVDENTLLGYIGATCAYDISHLHFVLYTNTNTRGGLVSFDAKIIPRISQQPEKTSAPASATAPVPTAGVTQPSVSIRRLDAEQSEVQVGPDEKKVPLLKDDVVVNKGLSIMEKIVSSLPSPTKERLKEWKFGVLSRKAIEAYGGETQGTGYVVISSESLNKFSDDAIAYVLSHEIAHCVVGHQGKVKFMEGLFAPVARLLLWFPEERLTRKQEEEADKFGVTFMVKAGYKVKGAMEFLDSLSWASDIPDPASLAPTRSERKKVIEEQAKALQAWEP
ncbi:MAG: hypothetical protein FJ395_19195 [Verrucomicrobia bacterium]|nr:hypothetical protein [Verrucomicrobiota bacterium]